VEGPTIIHKGSTYYLFYGANNYDTASSGIGHATSSSLLASYTKQLPVRALAGHHRQRPGAPRAITLHRVLRATRMAFAAWHGAVGYQNGGSRSLWIGTLSFSQSGTPSLS
jgi:hypothetical protein